MLERWDAVEADFQHYYGLDLREQVQAETPRRLLALVRGLPFDSATWRRDGFSRLEELLTVQTELTVTWLRGIYGTTAAGTTGARKAPPFFKFPRPNEAEAERQITKDPREVARFFARHSSEGR